MRFHKRRKKLMKKKEEMDDRAVVGPGIPVLVRRKKGKERKFIRKVYSFRKLLLEERERIKPAIIRNILEFTHGKPEGTNVMALDWDYLFILDACRYDFFKQFYDLGYLRYGKLEKINSLGRQTAEWMVNTFDVSKDYEDIVYVSANPYVEAVIRNTDLSFSHREAIWRDIWDEVWDTVTPKQVLRKVTYLRMRNRGKRFIIHLLQPHTPYLCYRLEHGKLREKIRRGEIGQAEVKRGYIYNLHRALTMLDDYIKKLDGRVVVTADHGELLGEWGLWFHKASVYHNKLFEVPLWRREKR